VHQRGAEWVCKSVRVELLKRHECAVQRAKTREIGRAQAPPTAGRVARTVQEAINTGGAVSIGAVNLVRSTALAALSAARDVGVKVGSIAVAVVRGSIVAATEIGGDLGRVSGRALNGTFGGCLRWPASRP
jgi:hypothetical protein